MTAQPITSNPTISRARRPAAHQTKGRRNLTGHIFLAVLILYFLLPLWWLFVASTKSAQGLFTGTGGPLWFDSSWNLWDNLQELFTYKSGLYLKWLSNSLLYSVVGGVGATVLAVLAGYGFAKYRFKGRDLSFAILLGSVMVPLTALVIPTFMLMSQLHLTNTIWAVILPSLLSPFGVYLMRVYAADSVPDELLDAARVDGSGEFRTFLTVGLPLMRPAVVTVLLLSVVGTWNNYFLPLAMLTNQNLYPITVGLGGWQALAASNNGGGANLYTLIIVGSLVSIIPLIIAFLCLQKYWQGGLSLGALK